MKQFIGYTSAILLTAVNIGWAGFPVPEGWRLPTAADMTGPWSEYVQKEEKPYQCRADFNGDGTVDDAFIVLPEKGPNWAVFVNLNYHEGKSLTVKLHEDQGKTAAQGMGVSVAIKGTYKTACGKGYWACEGDETPELKLLHDAINLYHFESANSFFWWDDQTNKFRRTWISD